MTLNARERQLLIALVVLGIVFLVIEIVERLYTAFQRVADVALIFLVAWAVAYLLAPLVDTIDQRTRLDRFGAVAVVYGAIAIVLVAAIALVLPPLADQLDEIRDRGPLIADNAQALAAELQATFDRLRVDVNVERSIGALPARLADVAGSIAADALGILSATATLVFNVTLVLIIAFLMVLDGPALWQRFTGVLGPELRSEAELLRQSADRSFGGFLRGSLVLGLIYGVATLAYLLPLGVPFAGVLALVAGLTVVIPFFGPIIAMVPVIVLTLLGAPDRLLAVFVLTVLLQQVTLNIIGPRVIGGAVGVHPLFVFLALLLGSRIAGFWGVLLALPIAGIVATFARYFYELARGRRTRAEAAQLMLIAEEAERATGAAAVDRRTVAAK